MTSDFLKKKHDETLAMKRVLAAFMSAAILAPITAIPVTLVTPIEAHALSREAREARDKIEDFLKTVAEGLVVTYVTDAIKAMRLTSHGKESQTLDRMRDGIDRVGESAAEDGEVADVSDVMEVVVEVCEDAGVVGDVVMTGLATTVTAETIVRP